MKQLTEDELQKLIDLMNRLVTKMPEDRMYKVQQMLAARTGDSFIMSPASAQVDRHSCYAGGLLQHSLNVVSLLKRLADALCPGRWTNDILSFVGLFHDLGKAGDGVHDYYVPNKSEWHREKLGKLYEPNPECTYMPVPERSLYLLQRHGVKVSSEEAVAIRLSEGQYVRENEPYRWKEPDLALLLHWAKQWAIREEKQGV